MLLFYCLFALATAHFEDHPGSPENTCSGVECSPTSLESAYDVIIIGSGVSGLTAASFLTKEGFKTLILEQDWKPGGCLTTFTRKSESLPDVNYEFPYLIDFPINAYEVNTPKGPTEFQYHKLPPPYGQFRMGPEIVVPFGVPGQSAFMYQCLGMFPKRKTEIRSYFAELVIPSLGSDDTVEDMVDRHFGPNLAMEEPILFALLTAQIEDVQDLPTTEPALYLQTYQKAFVDNGVQYPYDGSQVITDSLLDQVKQTGNAEIMTRMMVDSITTEKGETPKSYKVTGVTGTNTRTKEKFTVRAPVVLSTMGVKGTYVEPMLDAQVLLDTGYGEIGRDSVIASSVCILFAGFNATDEELGFIDKNLIYIDPTPTPPPEEDDGPPMSFSSSEINSITLRAPGTRNGAYSTITSMTTCEYGRFKKWEDSITHDRPEDYYQWKNDVLVPALTEHLYVLFPKAKGHLDVVDSATPLTIRDFLHAPGGSFCGLTSIDKELEKETKIEGLYMAGKDLNECGAQPSSRSGMIAAKMIIGKK